MELLNALLTFELAGELLAELSRVLDDLAELEGILAEPLVLAGIFEALELLGVVLDLELDTELLGILEDLSAELS